MLDRRAQLFAIDLLLAFIPLTIMLGMSANALSGMAVQVQDYANIYSLQRKTNDAADVLIKSPGTPPNWNSTIHPNVSGLAYYDPDTEKSIPNRLYSDKVQALNESDIINLTDTSNYYLNITLIGTSLPVSYQWGSDVPDNATSVAVAERYSNFVWSDLWGVMMDVLDVEKDTLSNCEEQGGQNCVTDNVTLTDWTSGDFWLYLDFDRQASTDIYVNEYLILTGSNFRATSHNPFYKCDNTESDDSGDCDKTVDGEQLFFKSIFYEDSTAFEPPSAGGWTANDVTSVVTRVKIPPDWVTDWNAINVTVTSNQGEVDGYVIRAPPGTPWNGVTPTLADPPNYAKLTLKVWTE